ncbi:MAG: hypothetical protein IPO27_15310 [Bacteroidetes bacterium]|nr:hypothetical protein [Bacteroidota bacterium]
MKKTFLKTLTFILLTMTVYNACKPKEDCEAGGDGALTLMVKLQHHGVTIYNQPTYKDTVYFVFNTQEAPALNSNLIPVRYDKMIVGTGTEDHVHVTNMKCGNYYIYAAGLDTAGPYRVTGGIPFSTEETTGEISVIVPVTE